MKNAHRFLSILFATVPLLAQETAGPSGPKARVAAAEQMFRDAWWAESGANDVEAALRGYLAAVAADGPAPVKARALLFAGRLQQRQGQAAAALASFRRVLTEFATETATVNEARGHLRELTAVDLRQNYDEWYERRLFSEEVQLTVLGKIEALAGCLGMNSSGEQEPKEMRQQTMKLMAELRAFGKGAVPALRKAAVGSHQVLANVAIDLLVECGEVPPLAALLQHEDWACDGEVVRQLLLAKSKEQLPEPLPDRLHAHGLAAAMRGPIAVAEFVLQRGARVDGEAILPWATAVLHNPEARQRLLAGLHEPTTSLHVRHVIETAFTQEEAPREVSAVEWMALGKDSVRAETRTVAVARATAQLGAEGAEVLDQLLGWLLDREAHPSGHDATLVNAFAEGLRRNRQPEMLPWSPARLRAVFVALPAHPEAQIDDAVMQLTRRETTRTMLVHTLFADPMAFAAAFRLTGDDNAAADNLGRNFLGAAGAEADVQMHGRRWNAVVAEAFTAAWPKYDEAARLAALLVLRGVVCHAAEKRPIAKALTDLRVAATVPVQAAIDALLAVVGG